MHMVPAGVAIALLLLHAGALQAREVAASKASVAPAKTQVAPQALPAKARLQSTSDAERRAYSEMADHVAASVADFADDNTTGNQDRDHVADPAAETSKGDAWPQTPASPKKRKTP